ncbi:MAG TPA: GerMN domain-containing protein [Mycobacteriales bacterium]|nr:GerMN domain-containing protein [Mycobacteriales bacterium]
MRRLLATVVALAALAALAGCGLPSGSLHQVDPAKVPPGLVKANSSSAPSVVGPPARVYFVAGARLVPEVRRVVGLNVPSESLRALLLGPTPAESAAGVASEIPPQTRLISLDLRGKVALVDLGSDFGSAGGSQQVLAVAQIVYTLTASRVITAVEFSIDGRRIEVPDGSGSLSTAPRTRGDYRDQAPQRP